MLVKKSLLKSFSPKAAARTTVAMKLWLKWKLRQSFTGESKQRPETQDITERQGPRGQISALYYLEMYRNQLAWNGVSFMRNSLNLPRNPWYSSTPVVSFAESDRHSSSFCKSFQHTPSAARSYDKALHRYSPSKGALNPQKPNCSEQVL